MEMAGLAKMGVSHVSITPFGYGQRTALEIPERYSHSRFRSETLETMRRLTRQAHANGLKVTLKPHLWFSRGGQWRGQIRPQDEAAWWRFYSAYRDFLRPYLELARDERIALFCLGTELGGTTDNEKLWRRLIADARKTYSGQLTYAAHWNEEPWRIRFWDALDVIGVQGYFPLIDFEDRPATGEQLRAGWRPWMAKLRALSERENRPVLFTELGYQPRVGTAHRPWVWNMPTPFSAEAQVNAFDAFFAAADGQEWLQGAHIWKWFSYERRGRRSDFSPQGLPAEELLRGRFSRGSRP